jgi:hypothetical protein
VFPWTGEHPMETLLSIFAEIDDESIQNRGVLGG